MLRLSASCASTDGQPSLAHFLLGDRYTRAVRSHPAGLGGKRGSPMTHDDFPKNAKDFFAYAKKHHAEMVDLKFVDMLGSWQHCSFPVDTLDEGTFEEGLGFDGSSIRGWMGIPG